MLREDAEQRWLDWFQLKGWTPMPFQSECWAAIARGESGLLQLPTGAGKTYAAYGGALIDALCHPNAGTQVLYITPLRALSRDIEKALREPVETLQLPLTVALRTGDTTSSQRAKQKKNRPSVLVTTPESLALLLSYPSAAEDFRGLRTLIFDEWHELVSTKRGSLLELCAARLRHFAPELKTWALSATLGNAKEAAEAALGTGTNPKIFRGNQAREVIVESVVPEHMDRFPWAGHLGLRMLPQVIPLLDKSDSTLIFTNTRSQAERWYQALLDAKPEWASIMALHHGSLDRLEREHVESGLKEGRVRIAVCTSSLDLGIDLAPVQQVLQIGSPKSIARLVQRAGRSAHSPGLACRLFFVPTHAWELIEIAAARDALERGQVESRRPLEKPLDVLTQHLVTVALGGGFDREKLFSEVRTAYSFRDLTPTEMDWALALIKEGGNVLGAYPDFHKVVLEDERHTVTSARIARRHRFNIGTIVSDSNVLVRYKRGGVLGTVEESYIARLRKGETFLFAGKYLELILVRDLVAYVRNASRSKSSRSPRWRGGKFPLSSDLSTAMRRKLGEIAVGQICSDREVIAAAPILETQWELSAIPQAEECLAEQCQTRDGEHLFLFPFEGRLVHEGLAALLAYRIGRETPTTFSISVNDYGIELLAPRGFDFQSHFLKVKELFTEVNLLEDFLAAVNLSELARRQFREVARVAGLVAQNTPGREKSSRQLQASSALLFDVFIRYDPENLLVAQARREVFELHFQQSRLRESLRRLASTPWKWCNPRHPTPLAFPLVVDRLSSKILSTETLEARITRMVKTWQNKSTSKSKGKRFRSFPSERFSGSEKKLSSAPTYIGESQEPSVRPESRFQKA